MNTFITKVNAIMKNTALSPLNINLTGTFDMKIIVASTNAVNRNPVKLLMKKISIINRNVAIILVLASSLCMGDLPGKY